MLVISELDVWDCVQSVDIIGRKTLFNCFTTMIRGKHRVSDIEDVRTSSAIDSFIPFFEVILLIVRKRNLLVHLVDDGTLDQLSFGSFPLFVEVLLVRNFLADQIWVNIINELRLHKRAHVVINFDLTRQLVTQTGKVFILDPVFQQHIVHFVSEGFHDRSSLFLCHSTSLELSIIAN